MFIDAWYSKHSSGIITKLNIETVV